MNLKLSFTSINFWLKWCVFNFFLVSVVGLFMRYNILFSLPQVSHKFLQQSHSHFAFYGWVSASIYALVFYYLNNKNTRNLPAKYIVVMFANQLGAYGMLFSFLYGGYYWLSIIFSSLCFFTGLVYFYFLWFDSKNRFSPGFIWLKIGAFFAAFSAIGIFGLSYFTSRRSEFEMLYKAATYFYLHFQYNGFFLFSCVGLFLFYIEKHSVSINAGFNNYVAKLFAIATFISFGLSVVWIKTHFFWLLFWCLVAIFQIYAAYLLLKLCRKTKFKFNNQPTPQQVLFIVFTGTFVIKFLLPLFTTIPFFTALAFFNTHIIMAYLHLILLVGISTFLIWKIVFVFQPEFSRFFCASIYLLVFGILLNEFFLVLQASTMLFNFTFFYASQCLFASALVIAGAIFLVLRALKTKK